MSVWRSGADERSPERRAAGVVAAVRAHEHERVRVWLPAVVADAGQLCGRVDGGVQRGDGMAPAATPARELPGVEVERLQHSIRRAVEVAPNDDDTNALLVQPPPPADRGVAGEVGVGDGIASPRTADFDQQPATYLRRSGEQWLVAVSRGGGALELNHARRLRWRGG